MPVFVGVDWAHDHHDVYVTNERSEQLGAFRIGHSVEGVDDLTKRLRAVGAEPSDVQVALERPGGLQRPGGTRALLDQGYAVYPINPKSVDRYRDRHQTGGAKHPLRWVPARDARALAHILRTDGDRFRPLRPESDLAAEPRLTIRAYRDLVAEGVRLTNQLCKCWLSSGRRAGIRVIQRSRLVSFVGVRSRWRGDDPFRCVARGRWIVRTVGLVRS